MRKDDNKKKYEWVHYSIHIQGLVQGIGFRPFLFRLANSSAIHGFARNDCGGVWIEACQSKEVLNAFIHQIELQKPALAQIHTMEITERTAAYLKNIKEYDPNNSNRFQIISSDTSDSLQALVLPDLATCPDCLAEIFNPKERRFLYPFTNCTHCGPRYSIINEMPYDRERTTMQSFSLCAKCQSEYNDPNDRRFHAQPIACPDCGPQLQLLDANGQIIAEKHEAIRQCQQFLLQSKIIALKGLGGFQFLANATDDNAVILLRQRKNRGKKPFALMMRNIADIKKYCYVSPKEEQVLTSYSAPIVLLPKKGTFQNGIHLISRFVAENNTYLGVMLPYTPLHHILLHELTVPIIATSGNLSNDPIITDEMDALKNLSSIADYFLIHNRPIARSVDDSIVRVIQNREMMLRRARGYTPLPLSQKNTMPSAIAFGGHLKNTIAVSHKNYIFLSQHIGDLDSARTLQAFDQTINDLPRLLRIKPDLAGYDLHPDYYSSHYASKYIQKNNIKNYPIQHHEAHLAACATESNIESSYLGVSWDGTGLGHDQTVWGGEFFIYQPETVSFHRFFYLRPFLLIGGDKAAKEPRRVALSMLLQTNGETTTRRLKKWLNTHFTESEIKIFSQMYTRQINSPWTSSMGRLFDAVSILLGLGAHNHFEGEAAMALEFAAHQSWLNFANPDNLEEMNHIHSAYSDKDLFLSFLKKEYYPIKFSDQRSEWDWQPLLSDIFADLDENKSAQYIAAKFHHTLSQLILQVAQKSGEKTVLLSGGVFQNKYLLEGTISLLQSASFEVHWPQRVPANDGGLALGQLVLAQKHYTKSPQ